MRHIAILGLALLLACTPESPPTPLPGASLRSRVEQRLEDERTALLESIGHFGLVYDVRQQDLHRFMAQIYPRRDGPDITMAAAGGIELHGGGVLELIAAHWQPDGHPAALSDAFPFASSASPVPLREIYDSVRMQLFLPVSADTEVAAGPLPSSPVLARMRVEHAAHGRLEQSELDAYNALRVLLRYEADLHATWTNRLGQRLSAALLLDRAWDHYVIARSAEAEFDDHSYLHLIEILLAYNRRLDASDRRDANSLKQRFLSVELEREQFGGYDASEALGHYAESLGFLSADPKVTWTNAEKAQVRSWLQKLETEWLVEIDDAPVRHLAHLLRGLRLIEANTSRLQ